MKNKIHKIIISFFSANKQSGHMSDINNKTKYVVYFVHTNAECLCNRMRQKSV